MEEEEKKKKEKAYVVLKTRISLIFASSSALNSVPYTICSKFILISHCSFQLCKK